MKTCVTFHFAAVLVCQNCVLCITSWVLLTSDTEVGYLYSDQIMMRKLNESVCHVSI
jgi:hypothetical protein